ncbi:AMP-binding protein [Actinomarinicola tropica]|uniref:AMP-binding protein n=1 Tax=Actinomarinicola tropica TaxID=2789776 RepID=A0A5Q2RIR1_9ACTN|nr:AMP-binding protein [Actinomarinicola tropica]QGG95683.1 AMP-binding protein [Actinomarinicola tropica]
MSSLSARIEASAHRGGAITFVGAEDPVRVPWSQLHDDARSMAAGLQARGVAPGDHVAILGPTSRPLVTAIQAVWLAGATIVVMPIPMRMGSIEEFVAATRRRLHRADVALFLIDPDLAPFVEPEPGDPPIVGLDEVSGPGGASRYERPADDLDRLAILQFTSGSTADPKGVALPHRAVGANLDAIAEAAALDPDDDVLVSWLPLYHDMGLVGLLTLAMTTGTDLVLGAPQDFMAAPLRWMQWLSDFGGTATAGPNFSYVLAARALRRAEGLDLSRLRIALNGAEPVDPDTVEAFVAAAAPFGMRPGAVFPAFGMAEVAIAGTFPPPLAGLRTDVVDLKVLESERYAAPIDADAPHARRLAKLGRAVPGLQIRIVDPATGQVLSDREAGELEIQGTSVCSGYYNDPEATAELFRDGWLRTGDLAYTIDDELVMCGRIKDVIIVGGRNVFPEDIERAVSGVDGVRPGNVIAFGVEGRNGREAIVVVAETKAEDTAAMHGTINEHVRRVVGTPAKDIVLVPPGTLPKTSSGKLQRSLCRQRYLEVDLQRA